MENGVDPDESYNFIDTLLDRLLDKSSRKQSTLPRSLSDENSYMLCKVIDNELGERACSSALQSEDLGRLRILPQLFENYILIYPDALASEVIIWAVAKVLSLISSPRLYERIGGPYQEHLIALCKYLPPAAKNFLLKQSVVALFGAFFALLLFNGTAKGFNEVRVKISDNSEETTREIKCAKGSVKLTSVTIVMSDISENRHLLQQCLLDLIQHGGFDLNYLDECKLLYMTWLTLLRLVATSSFALKNKCVLIVQRLLSLDLCNSVFASALLRTLFAVEGRLAEIGDTSEGVIRLEESLATCEQTFANCLRRDLIQHGGFDLNYLDECKLLYMTWLTLLRLVATSSFALKNKCVLIIQRLLSLDLCNSVFASALLRTLFAVEGRLAEVGDTSEDVIRLEESLATCEQTFANCLRRFRSQKTFEDVGLKDIVEWTAWLLDLCRKQQPTLKERTTNLLAALCSILSRLKDVDEAIMEKLVNLASNVTSIVQTLFVCDPAISVGQLGDLFSFIFKVDKWKESSELGNEVVRLVCAAKDKFVGIEVVKAIRIQQLVISAVKKATNGEKTLSLIIPQGGELLQVLHTVSTMTTGGDEILLSLIALISTLIDCIEKEQINWIAFLSMPWLTVRTSDIHLLFNWTI
uniref:HEAT repeat-containing protein 1 n=1 Tax=Ascaris lumbricoides TaxID=6252 RepID=A0A0M3IKN9_ASCLU